jgi:5-(carboxyamino)imidazole ribonucleotide synthase
MNDMDKTIGVLGGGQLGKMLFEAGSPMNTQYAFLEATPNCPASLVCQNHVLGGLYDANKIRELAQKSSIITYEIEHVNVAALQEIEASGTPVIPKPAVLTIIQDKGLQKEFYSRHNIPSLPYQICTASELESAVSAWSENDFVLKHRRGGYDGKGVQVLNKQQFAKLREANDASLTSETGYVIEQLANQPTEISVIVAVDLSGNIQTYAPSEMVFDPKSNLMDYLIAPSQLTAEVIAKCEAIATQAVEALASPGLFAVELFVQQDDVYVNEIAPRPHNSGHHTIESCYTSQYEQLNRILLGHPLGSTALISAAATCNIVGPANVHGAYRLQGLHDTLQIEGVYLHMYGKKTTSPDRKLGHFTVLAHTREAVVNKMEKVKELLSVVAL